MRLGRLRDGQHEHRPGFDITFSAPKSVSLAALLPTEKHPRGDRGVMRAHDEAVRTTLDWIEDTMLETRGWDPATRRRPRIKSPSMVAATFRHIASRNLDPQLHTHAVIANMTRDAQGRWKSVEPMSLHRNARLIGAFYRNELSRRLIAKGYSILPAMAGRIQSFEIAGYDKELRDAFSTRRSDILEYLEKEELAYSQRSTQIASYATRKRKAEPVRSMLETNWIERVREMGLATGLCCKLGEGAMRDQGASCSPYDSALARRSCSHAMASVRAHGQRSKARSTIRASPTMPPWRANIPAWPLRSARITSKPLIVA